MTWTLAFMLSSAIALAAPPSCETKVVDEQVFEACERADIECDKLASDQVANPSPAWNGCRWAALITKGHFISSGLIFYTTRVTVVTSFVDSERVDLVVDVELSNHQHKTFTRNDVPVIIKNGIPQATIDIGTPEDPFGVPTVQAVEKGGKKQASHSYR